MNMRFGGITLSIIALLLAAQAAAAEHPKSRADQKTYSLTNEPSRAQLFHDFVVKAYEAGETTSGPQPASLAIPEDFTFPNDAFNDRIENHPRSDSVFGIDISHYTGRSISLKKLRGQDVRFVYVKATQGAKGRDRLFGSYWKQLQSLTPDTRIPKGAYLFLSSSDKGTKQAEAFVDYVNSNGGFSKDDLPPVVDLEWDVGKDKKDHWRGKGQEAILKELLACLNRIKDLTGRTPLVYTAASWWGPATIRPEKIGSLAGFPVWIADYNPKRKLAEKPAVLPGNAPVLWQFSDGALVSEGYDKRLDASVFHGSKQEFETIFGTELP